MTLQEAKEILIKIQNNQATIEERKKANEAYVVVLSSILVHPGN